ncbi:uncharacterized protein LOC131662476 [Vicia villosa]|uniref:uncharacterized protein LOC131662476 n=1 Tax=Vicia villosa TaxID=3911 RepID=UPI00273B0349|nr:uncharacterized protein LOC131662476 [Vicia villosa]
MGSDSNNARSGKTAAVDVVATVKEIVNCTEQEIYDVLKDCDMDPNLAVEKLLAQDTFREVRSKREKRKEMKEAVDSRTKGNITGLSKGGKIGIGIGNDPGVVQNGFHHVAYKENGKAVDKQDVGSLCASVMSSTTHVAGKSTKADSLYTNNGRQSLGTGFSMSDTVQVSPAPLPWSVGASKGHLSMADIVRMGTTSHDAVSHDHCNSIGVTLSGNSESSLNLPCQNNSEQQGFQDEWPVIEQPISGNAQALHMSSSSNANGPSEHDTEVSLHRNRELDAAEVSREEISRDNAISEKIESASISNNTGLGPHSNSNLKNTLTSDFQSSYEHHEGVSSVTSDLQRLSMKESNLEVPSSDDIVVLPNHLQALAAECSHLSFGTYKGGNNSASSETFTPNNLSRDGMEMKSATVDDSLAQFLDPSALNLGNQPGIDVLRGISDDQNYDLHSTLGHEYNTRASISDHSLQKSQWMAPSLPLKQPGLQSGNHSSFPGELHNSSNSSPQDLLAFLLAESQRSKHKAEPSINNFPPSMSDVSRDTEPGTFALHNRSGPTQGFTMQPNNHFQQSQEAYYSLPQNQSYMTTIDSQRAFSDNSAYSRSHANVNYNSLPQNRNELLMSRLHPSTVSDAPGYGNLDSSFYHPGSFQSNTSLGNMKPSSNFNEILTSQYYGAHNLSSIQPHDSFSQREYEARLRSSLLPDKTQYTFTDQPSQASLSQYASNGYSDFYPSWSQIPEEQKQTGSVQDLLPRQLHQFWQHNR